MDRHIATVSLLVRDYDPAIRFFVDALGFSLLEDTALGATDKRWVVVSPGDRGAALLLARADGAAQQAAVGNQGGGRVFLFLRTDDVARDHALFQARGVYFEEALRHEPYGSVAVFRDICGNRWDLIGPRITHKTAG